MHRPAHPPASAVLAKRSHSVAARKHNTFDPFGVLSTPHLSPHKSSNSLSPFKLLFAKVCRIPFHQWSLKLNEVTAQATPMVANIMTS